MNHKIELWPEPEIEADGSIIYAVTIEPQNCKPSRLWYRVPSDYRSLITFNCDPFVIGTIFLAMSQTTNLMVHGEVSPSLLQNLAEFQAAWACWRPDRYKEIEIIAEIEKETITSKDKVNIAAFSGGVDSCFTMFRHRTKACGRVGRNLQAGLMIHGFDIPLEQQDVFDRAAAKSKVMLDSLGVKLIPIATNFRELNQDWEDAHGSGIASCLMLFQRCFEAGIIASSDPYHALNLPYGSNPISDGLMSSNSFQIVHDGASFNRVEKIRRIAAWPEALQNLRVCWEGSQKDRNCGRCEKCIRNILIFRALGLSLPPCFDQDITDTQILLTLKNLKKSQLIELYPILEVAKSTNFSYSWIRVLEKCIKRCEREILRKQYKEVLKQQVAIPLKAAKNKLQSLLYKRD